MNSLRAFEAVVRLSSVSAAAGELGVTHGAISRQIKNIEEFLGLELFRSSGRGLEPTELAREYAAELRVGLDRIRLATEHIAQPDKSRVLRVNSTHTFAMRWLIPRLSTFQQRHPGIDIRIATSSLTVEQLPSPFDIALRRGPMRYPGFACRVLMSDTRVPVCAPRLLAELPIRTARDIRKHTLLCPERPLGAWEGWLSLADIPTDAPLRRLRFENYYVALQAALEGLGLLLAPLEMIQDDIKAGRLVIALREPTYSCHPMHILHPEPGATTLRTMAFIDWIFEQARKAEFEADGLLATRLQQAASLA